MDNSEFSQQANPTDTSLKYAEVQRLSLNGATCDTFKVRIYGKLHFLKRPHNIQDIRLQNAFRKEFEIGFNLDHPGIVRYVSFDPKTFSILTEWIEGATLSRFIIDNPDYFKNNSNIDRFITQLTDAVQYLHNHSVIHLDLKPDNIMITDIDRSVRVIDLGFAVSDCFNSTPGMTPRFSAPEQTAPSQHSSIDCRTDIYVIGRIVEYIFNQTNTRPNRRYRKFINRCTATDNAQRPTSATQATLILKPQKTQYPAQLLSASILIVGLLLYNIFQPTKDNSATVADLKIDTTSIIKNTTTMIADTLTSSIDNATKPTEKPKTPKSKDEQNAKELAILEAYYPYELEEGYYEVKKAWFKLLYPVADSLRRIYIDTDSSQLFGDKWSKLYNNIVIGDTTIEKQFPDIDLSRISSTGWDVVQIVSCITFHKSLYTQPYNSDYKPDALEYAHRKAALLK